MEKKMGKDLINLLLLSSLAAILIKASQSQPSTSSNSQILNNFYITWTPRETQTDYVVIANFENMTMSNLWFAIGFNFDKPTMV
jgi:hypothetical protein